MTSPGSVSNPSPPSLTDLVESNRRLARQVTTASLLAVVSLVAAGVLAAVVYRERKSVHHLLNAKSLTISDRKGTPRVWIGVNETGPGVSVMGEDGKARVWAGLSNEQPSVSVFDKGGQNRISLGLSDDESAYIISKTADGKARISFGLSKDSPYLEIKDKQGKMLFKQP